METQKSKLGWWVAGIIIVLIIVGVIWSMTRSTPIVQNTTEQTQSTSQTPETTPTAKTYALADVAAHATAADCWTAISGKVYDITAAIPTHPGGQAITQACGKDGTTLFNTRNNGTPHPREARASLETYYIGDLAQ